MAVFLELDRVSLLYDLPVHRRALLSLILLVCYWALLQYMPVPGVGPGRLREGANAISYLNLTYLKRVGLEGLPLVIPTSCISLLGTVLGDLLRQSGLTDRTRALLLLGCGLVLLAAGEIWAMGVPPIKPVWTPSYALIATGAGAILLSALYAAIDIRRWKAWAFPLVVFGSNAILAYVAPILFKDVVLRSIHLSTTGVLRAGIYTIVWWGVLYALYRRRIFLKV